MKDSLTTLIKSKRVMVAVVGLLTVLLSQILVHHIGLSEEDANELASKLATSIVAMSGTLIASIGISDHGKAMGKPAGVGHKEEEGE